MHRLSMLCQGSWRFRDPGSAVRDPGSDSTSCTMISIDMAISPSRLRDPLTGVIGFPVTPFRPDLSVDLEALGHNVRAMLEHPLAAIVAAGGTGELVLAHSR